MFHDTKKKTAKKEEATRAHELSNRIEKTGLFFAYPSLALEWHRLRREYATYVDNIPDYIKKAAEHFFIEKFRGRSIEIDFKDKPTGMLHINLVIIFLITNV